MPDPSLTDCLDEIERQDDVCRCVVRLKTSVLRTKRGIRVIRDISILRRLSSGFNILDEDASNIGAAQFADSITNLDASPDGIYEIVIVNQRYDWESGFLDDYDYELVPVEFNGPPLWMFKRYGKKT